MSVRMISDSSYTPVSRIHRRSRLKVPGLYLFALPATLLFVVFIGYPARLVVSVSGPPWVA